MAEQRRLRTEELLVTRVLDERGRVDPTVGADGESARSVRDKLETARRLASLPSVAAAAYAGRLSDEQLGAVVQLADEDSDAEWAARAPHVSPADLARLARTQAKPSTDDSRARYAARGLRMWWTPDQGMLHFHGQLPDVLGARFEATIQRLTDRAKPVKGQPWARFEHRAADALVGMCDAVDVAEQVQTRRWPPNPCSRSVSPRTDRWRWPGFRSPTRWSSSCAPTRPWNPPSSTTTALGSRTPNGNGSSRQASVGAPRVTAPAKARGSGCRSRAGSPGRLQATSKRCRAPAAAASRSACLAFSRRAPRLRRGSRSPRRAPRA